MSVSITGDFAAFAAFQTKIADIKGAPKRIALEAIPDLTALVAQEFAAGEDPYGNPWAPLKAGGSPLQPLADEVKTTLVGGTRIRVSTSGYLNFHHHGTRQLAAKSVAKKLGAELKARTSGARLSGESKGKAGRGLRESLAAEKKNLKSAAAIISKASGIHDPARPVIPNDESSIPPAWTDVLERIANKVLSDMGAS